MLPYLVLDSFYLSNYSVFESVFSRFNQHSVFLPPTSFQCSQLKWKIGVVPIPSRLALSFLKKYVKKVNRVNEGYECKSHQDKRNLHFVVVDV